MTRILISLALVLAPLAACTTAAVPQRRVAAVEKPAPAPAPAPLPPLEPEDQLANPYVEELVVEDPACPLMAAGTRVAFVENETGAALMFETPEVAEIQTHLDAIALAHNRELPTAAADAVPSERDETIHASGGVQVAPRAPEAAPVLRVTTPSTATVEVNGTGLRLVFTAQPEHLEALREELGQHALALASGRCSASP